MSDRRLVAGVRIGRMSVPRLRRGDRVGFVSAASPPDREAAARGADLRETRGLHVEIARHAVDSVGCDDADRLRSERRAA